MRKRYLIYADSRPVAEISADLAKARASIHYVDDYGELILPIYRTGDLHGRPTARKLAELIARDLDMPDDAVIEWDYA